MKLEIEKRERTLIIKFDGELDHHSASEIRERIDKEINNSSTKNLIMDFNELSFMDSSGIGVIIGRYKLIQNLEGKTCLINVNSQISRIVEVSGLKKLIPIYSDLDEALKNIKG